VNGVLAIKPIANLAASSSDDDSPRRENWCALTKEVQRCVKLLSPLGVNRVIGKPTASVQNPQLNYPDYYCRSFHAYEKAINWEAALEVEVAAYAVHAGIWPDAGAQGDLLRQSYHSILKAKLLTSRETS